MTKRVRIVGMTFFALLAVLLAAWSATAIYVHFDGWLRFGLWGLVCLALLAIGVARQYSLGIGWLALVIGALAIFGWYQTITPRTDRNWAFDVSRGVRAERHENHVTLHDLRDFDWRSERDATPRWISETYDLERLQTVDMFTSVWDSPNIAHLLVSFGFDDGKRAVFSVEIRREEGEVFNQIGGFFREFELVLIGATERDIIKLRTNYRKEDVSLFPIRLTPQQRREMFLAYVELAQELEKKPRFYNTLTANCTTVVYQLAKRLKADMPQDWRVIASGHLPDYLDGLGVLGGDGPMDLRKGAAKISKRAQQSPDADDYSALIRMP